MSDRLRSLGLALLHPFWRRAPLRWRRRLIWGGADKFIVGVSAICLDPDDRMLILEHRFHNEYPWGIPGGWLDRGESPLFGAMREVREETGLEPRVEGLVHVTGDGRWLDIYYLVRVERTEPTIQQSEIASYRWVDPRAPGVLLMPRQRQAVALVAGWLRDEHRLLPPLPHP